MHLGKRELGGGGWCPKIKLGEKKYASVIFLLAKSAKFCMFVDRS
jgi:hypothetical protein